MPKKNVQSPAVGNSRKEYTSATQTLLEVWQTLVNHSSAKKPLSVPEICSLMKENSLHASPSAATLKRALPSKADVLNTLHPNKVLCQEDLPNILLSYFSDHTLHVVLEDRLGEVIKEADCTVIVEPKAEILPPSYSTVEKLLQKLMAANADALFPLRLKCVRLENAPSGKRYIPYVEWEERYEKEGLKNNQARRYYLESILTPAEWRIFSDLVQVYPHISKAQTDKFLGVLKKFSPELESRINRRYAFKRGSGMQFGHIRIIDDAIRSGHPVSLRYGEYRLKQENGAWTPKLTERENHGHLTIDPYALMWSNGYYYLVGKEQEKGGMMNLRVDRILSIAPLVQQKFQRDASFDPYAYRDQSPVMYPGTPQVIRLRCHTAMVNTILDFFGTQAHFSRPINDRTEVTLNIAPSGVKLFALQYADNVEVLEPASLREDVIQSLENALRRYSKR